MEKIKVLSLIDSLKAAGAERVAVNITNGLVNNGVESHLCATRYEGPLKAFISEKAHYYFLDKKSFVDIRAFFKLIRYIKKNRIQIVHAHSTSFSWAFLIKILLPQLKVMWHIHHGNSVNFSRQRTLFLRNISRIFDFVFVVNQPLHSWGLNTLKIPESQIFYLRNFPSIKMGKEETQQEGLPNPDAFPKILHLAYFRPPKDHFTLLNAFGRVKENYSQAQLYLVGGNNDDEYFNQVYSEIENFNTKEKSIHILGSRNNVGEIMKSCDVGVLSSASEGLPLALLEYGLASLPVVCTNVGECPVVLNYGEFGVLLEPGNPESLGKAIVSVLDNPHESNVKAENFKKYVEMKYSEGSVIDDVISIYSAHVSEKVVDLQ